jgi:lipopolysaccharide transport system ATP-binding protein
MKILARVTVPTEGEASVVGRVAGLLQAGTGFHPELTGRDNIMLSGAILGMTSREIDAVFEDVVAFAEIGRFLNTPVKHYSSGMQMRLGFSVSAHLMADVMLIDEVLSVGDSAFQRKCRTRIKDLVSQGRTVLLASHSMGTVKELCSSVLVLDGGIQVFFGAAREGIALYEEDVSRR